MRKFSVIKISYLPQIGPILLNFGNFGLDLKVVLGSVGALAQGSLGLTGGNCFSILENVIENWT